MICNTNHRIKNLNRKDTFNNLIIPQKLKYANDNDKTYTTR